MIKCSFMEEKEERNIWYLWDVDLIISEWNERAHYINVESFLCSSVYLLFCSFFFFSSLSSFLLHFSYLVNVLFVCNYSLYKVCKLKIQGNICMRARVHIYVYIIRIHIYVYTYNIHIYAHMHRCLYIFLCLFHLFLILGSYFPQLSSCENSETRKYELKWKVDNFLNFRYVPVHFFKFYNGFLQASTKIT